MTTPSGFGGGQTARLLNERESCRFRGEDGIDRAAPVSTTAAALDADVALRAMYSLFFVGFNLSSVASELKRGVRFYLYAYLRTCVLGGPPAAAIVLRVLTATRRGRARLPLLE